MPRIAILTPLPPVKSGIAGYAAVLLPALARRCEVVAVVDQPAVAPLEGVSILRLEEFLEQRGAFDAVYCQLGNNPYHELAYRYAMEHPSIVVLHDLVLHHLVVEMTLARGDAAGYAAALGESHGAAGEAWARGRAAGFHNEIGNFLFPASIALANRSARVIVHNEYAAGVLRSYGVTAPVDVVGHPEPPIATVARAPERGLIGMFGFVTSAKRPEVVFEAFARALERNDRLHLLVAGEPAPNVDLAALASRFAIPPDRWTTTGFVTDAEFDAHLGRVEKVVNLRYPSAGETSGALIRVFAFGKPVAVSDYAQFAELPDGVATKIPFDREVDALAEFFANEPPAVARAQREWLDANASLERAVDGYLRFGPREEVPASAPRAGIPLFPRLRLLGATRGGRGLAIALRNDGPSLRAAVYGEPAYRLIAKLYDGAREIHASWHRLSRDLATGEEETIEISLHLPDALLKLTLQHALEGIPAVDATPFASHEVGR